MVIFMVKARSARHIEPKPFDPKEWDEAPALSMAAAASEEMTVHQPPEPRSGLQGGSAHVSR